MRRVEISSCTQCPYFIDLSTGTCRCGLSKKLLPIEIIPEVEIPENCLLEKVILTPSDHSSAIKTIYSLIQPKGLNLDSINEANLFLNQYLKDLEQGTTHA